MSTTNVALITFDIIIKNFYKFKVISENNLDKQLQSCYNIIVFESRAICCAVERMVKIYISDIYKKPPKDYTSRQWRSDFEEIKSKVIPTQERFMRVIRDSPSYGSYHGKTQYQQYCSFINNILKSIRRGEIDYCFYIYQIQDLLKFEERLKVEWLQSECCFRLSL